MKGSRPLDDGEIEKVMATLPGSRERAFFVLGIKSGFRISELLSLRVADVLQYGRVVDRVTVRRANMKKKIEGRTVRLHPAAQEALMDWLEEFGDVGADTFVFRSRKGLNRPIGRGHAWRILKRAYASSRLPGRLGTHAMRKTFAAKVHAVTQDIIKTQRALGHRNINSTMSYLSFAEEDVERAILAA